MADGPEEGPLKRDKRGLQAPPSLPHSGTDSIPEEAFAELQKLLHTEFNEHSDEVCVSSRQLTVLGAEICVFVLSLWPCRAVLSASV